MYLLSTIALFAAVTAPVQEEEMLEATDCVSEEIALYDEAVADSEILESQELEPQEIVFNDEEPVCQEECETEFEEN